MGRIFCRNNNNCGDSCGGDMGGCRGGYSPFGGIARFFRGSSLRGMVDGVLPRAGIPPRRGYTDGKERGVFLAQPPCFRRGYTVDFPRRRAVFRERGAVHNAPYRGREHFDIRGVFNRTLTVGRSFLTVSTEFSTESKKISPIFPEKTRRNAEKRKLPAVYDLGGQYYAMATPSRYRLGDGAAPPRFISPRPLRAALPPAGENRITRCN